MYIYVCMYVCTYAYIWRETMLLWTPFISVPLCTFEDISEEYKPSKRIAGPYDCTNLYSFQESINSSYSTVLVTVDIVRLQLKLLLLWQCKIVSCCDFNLHLPFYAEVKYFYMSFWLFGILFLLNAYSIYIFCFYLD